MPPKFRRSGKAAVPFRHRALIARQALGLDGDSPDIIAHSCQQDPGLGIKTLAIRQQILFQCEFNIRQRQLHGTDDVAHEPVIGVATLVAIQVLLRFAYHVCLVFLLDRAFGSDR